MRRCAAPSTCSEPPAPGRSRRLHTCAAVAALLCATGVVLAEELHPTLRFGTLWYLSGQRSDGGGPAANELVVKRGHFDFYLDITSTLAVRVTPDVTIDAAGEAEAPVKFAYIEARRERLGALVKPFVQIGRVPTPWIGFEEGIYRYRMQDGTFMDRLGFFASADEGIAIGALLGSGLPERFLEQVRPTSRGRWGSFAVGLYSGSGFKATDRNDSRVFQGRTSVRPLPDSFPGLQLAALAVRGAGNTSTEPDWTVTATMASVEWSRAVATLQWTDNLGVQSGAWVDGSGEPLPGSGWSAFVELRERPGPGWAAFARHDWYDADTPGYGGRFTRTIAGVARHLAGGSAILLDYELQHFEDPDRADAGRLQLTAQLRLAPVRLAGR